MIIKLKSNIFSENIYLDPNRIDNVDSKKVPAIFLDRDGVLIKDKHYISAPKDVELELFTKELLNIAYQEGWLTIVITNQSGISRGYLSWEDYHAVNKKMLNLLGQGSPITAIYGNSLGPASKKNSWRKPSPKMIFHASNKLKVDLEKSIIIGDRLSDIKAGYFAKLPILIHLLTGHGLKERDAVMKFIEQKQKLNKQKFLFFPIQNLKEFPFKYLK